LTREGPSAQKNAPRHNARLLLQLVIVTSIAHCCYAGSSFCLTLYAVHLHASPFQIGALIATYSVVASLTSVAAGRLADRRGARTPMLVCAAGMVAGAALVFAWRQLPALFIGSVLIGTLYNAYFVAQQQVLGRFGSLEEKVRIFSLSGLGVSLANFAGPFGAGYSLKALGYPETFLVLACVPLVPLLLIGTNRIVIPPARPRAATGGQRGGVLGLLRIRELRVIYGVRIFSSVTFQLFAFLMPLHGVAIGLDTIHIGWVVGSFAVASALSRLALPQLSRRFAPWSVLLGALCVAALCFGALAVVMHLAALMLTTFCLGAAFGLCNPVAQALLLEAGPPERGGEIQGLNAMMVGAIQTTVPLAAGAASAAVGIAPIFGCFALALGGCCYVTRGRFRLRRQ
jgi:MFS family permease